MARHRFSNHWLIRPWRHPPPPDYRWIERMGTVVPTILIYAIGYFLCEHYGYHLAPRTYDVSLAIDHRIPLWTGMIYGYMALYLLLAAGILSLSRRDLFFTAVKGMLFQAAICFPIFLLWPVRMLGRPDELVHRMPGVAAHLLSLYYAIDLPINLFPSMHLSVAAWVARCMTEEHPRLKWPLAALIGWIAFSVLFTRQHYIADVVGGLAVAALTRAVFLPIPGWTDRGSAPWEAIKRRFPPLNRS